MDITSDLAVAGYDSANPAGWEPFLAGVLAAFAGRFGRVERRRTAAAFVTGLLDPHYPASGLLDDRLTVPLLRQASAPGYKAQHPPGATGHPGGDRGYRLTLNC